MADDVLKFDDYQDEHDDGLVRCARCGKHIPAISTRCPKCGVHFRGEAQDFFHSSEPVRASGHKMWFVLVAIVLVVLLILGAMGGL